MSYLSYQIVRPDKLLSKGDATSITLITRTGELGVLPGHAPEICALGDGVMRINHLPDADRRAQRLIVVSGGYAQITGDTVIVLADHARDVFDIEPQVVMDTKDDAEDELAQLEVGDARRAYFESKMRWCDLLLSVHARYGGQAQRGEASAR